MTVYFVTYQVHYDSVDFSRLFFFLVVMMVYFLTYLDGYCSTVQGLLDWFEVDLGFTELLFIQIGLCVMFVFGSLCDLSSSP